MKFKLLFLPVALLATSLLHSEVRAQQVDVNFFYTSLQDKGDWFHTDNYGYVFQPRRATTSNWRPYADGHWSYTDQGWTWISNEDFGWATYHYGRWAKLQRTGWVWIPGDQWAPAWVSWRTQARYGHGRSTTVTTRVVEDDSDYIGWAPLPPEARFEGSVGFTSRVDAEYNIGPDNYCFVPTRSFSAPVLTTVIIEPTRNVYFIGRTINVTNTSYSERGGTTLIFNGGPDYTVIETVVERPIPRLVIERQTNIVYTPGATTAQVQYANQIRGNSFQVIAPQVAATAIFTPGAPPPARAAAGPKPAQIKAELKQVERAPGWDAAGAQPQVVQAAREQVKRDATEAPKKAEAPPAVPPAAPSKPAAGTTPTAVTTPTAGTTPTTGTTPATGTTPTPSAATPSRSPATSPAPTTMPAPTAQPSRPPVASPAPSATPPQSSVTTQPSRPPAATAAPTAAPAQPTRPATVTTPPATVPSVTTPPTRPPVTSVAPKAEAPQATPIAPTRPAQATKVPAPTVAPTAVPRETPAKPADTSREREAADQQKREAMRQQQKAVEDQRKAQAPKAEAPRPEPTRPEQAQKQPPMEQERKVQAERARPTPPPAAAAADAQREALKKQAEAARKPEAPKKPEATPVPTP